MKISCKAAKERVFCDRELTLSIFFIWQKMKFVNSPINNLAIPNRRARQLKLY